MAQYMNQRQMETLSTSLKPSVKKKNTKTTQGKVVPVMKKANPYKPPVRKPPAPGKPSIGQALGANVLGANKQQEAIQSRQPVSTQFNVSYESDPVLARIKALGTQDVANARAEADALRKKAIIESGLTDVGQEIGVDSSTIEAARQNPFSTRAELERSGQMRGREMDEQLNQQNLFYGGYRADQLAELARNQAQAQTALTGDIRSLLGGINSGVMEAEQQAALQEQQAIAEAAEASRIAAMQQAYLDSLAGAEAPALAPAPDITTALGTPSGSMGVLAPAPGDMGFGGIPFEPATDNYLGESFDAEALNRELALLMGLGGSYI